MKAVKGNWQPSGFPTPACLPFFVHFNDTQREGERHRDYKRGREREGHRDSKKERERVAYRERVMERLRDREREKI
jgi:hypothetical protein